MASKMVSDGGGGGRIGEGEAAGEVEVEDGTNRLVV
jgi:hypothetical protein